MHVTWYRLVIVAFIATSLGIGLGWITSVGASPAQDTVYVATGENFPDALGVGSVAALTNAPVLFVRKDSIPAATTEELNRLQPANIVIVGGTGVVSDAVKTTLEGMTFHPTVTRLAGADRYATAVEVSKSRFPAALDADTLEGKSAAELQTGAWSVYHDSSVTVSTSGLASVLQLQALPAGSYVIIAKSWWFENTSLDRYVHCRLVAGADFDDEYFTAVGNQDGVGPILTVVHTFTAANSTVDLRCTSAPGANVTLSALKITAIGVDTLVNAAG